MEFIPQNVRFASAKLSGYSRNRFKIMPTGSSEASAGRQTIFNLPENALIDTASLRLHFTVTTSGATEGSTNVYARLPADASSLIQRLNVSINGVSVQNQSSEYNSVCRLLKLAGGSSRDRDGSVDRAVSHGAISSQDVNETASLIISEWHGILNESSTRFWPTNALGAVQIEMTWAENSVLVPKQASKGFAVDDDLSADAKTAAAQISYSVSGLYMTVDTIQFGDGMYDQLLRKRLSEEPYIPIAFRDYFTFSHDGINSDSKSIRFAVSASSIDKIYTSFRNGSYRSVGIRGHTLEDVGFSDAICSNYFRFQSYDSQSTRAGTLKMQYQVNNTPHPTYEMNVPEALCDLAYVNDKIGPSAPGIMQTSLQSFNDGLFVCPLTLSHPSGNMIGQMGYDSRGVASQMEFLFTGMSVPTASDDLTAAQQTASVSAFTVVQVTSELRLSLGREVVVAH